MPTHEAKLLTVMALLAYAAAAITALVGLRMGPKKYTLPCTLIVAGGLILNLAALAVRAMEGRSPLSSGFDVFTLLGMLFGAMALYLRVMDTGRAPEVVLLPPAIACSFLALLLSGGAYKDFARGVWNAAHVAFAVGGVVCFAIAAAAGVIYLRTHRLLRRKDPAVFGSHWPSLERLDRFIHRMLPIGFSMLTLAIAVGLHEAFARYGAQWFGSWPTHPKMLVAGVAWLIYAVALHASFARRFRGRQAAALSIAGFTLLLVVLLVSILMPRYGT